jgi:hypothetical protein
VVLVELDRLFQVNFKPVWAFLFAVFNYLICPNAAYMPAIAAVWVAVILDIFTRLFANSRRCGGFLVAIRERAISSDTLWTRTAVKVVAYLCLQILAGLSMKVLPLEQVSIAVATIVYSFLFIREATSVVENLVEAGAEDLKPMLFWLKKKEADLTEGQLDVKPLDTVLPQTKKPLAEIAPEPLDEEVR